MAVRNVLKVGARALGMTDFGRCQDPTSTTPLLADPETPSPSVEIDRGRRHPQNLAEAGRAFVEWMRDSGYTDYLTPDELDAAYLDHCKHTGFKPIDARRLREAVRVQEGVFYGRQRIAGVRWQRLRQRVHKERPVLYRIMYYDEFEDDRSRPDAYTFPDAVRTCPGSSGPREEPVG